MPIVFPSTRDIANCCSRSGRRGCLLLLFLSLSTAQTESYSPLTGSEYQILLSKAFSEADKVCANSEICLDLRMQSPVTPENRLTFGATIDGTVLALHTKTDRSLRVAAKEAITRGQRPALDSEISQLVVVKHVRRSISKKEFASLLEKFWGLAARVTDQGSTKTLAKLASTGHSVQVLLDPFVYSAEVQDGVLTVGVNVSEGDGKGTGYNRANEQFIRWLNVVFSRYSRDQ